MTNVTADLVKALRDRTSVGVLKCRDALVRAAGDLDKAEQLLREEGIASSSKKEHREVKAGKIVAAQNDETIALIELMAETDFVSSSDPFIELATLLASEALHANDDSIESFLAQKLHVDPSLSVDNARALLMQKVGENIQLRRFKRVAKKENQVVGFYSHLAGSVVAVACLEGESAGCFANVNADEWQALARGIAVHVAANNPVAIRPDLSKGIASEDALLSQPWFRDSSMTVEAFLEKEGARLGHTRGHVAWILCWVAGS